MADKIRVHRFGEGGVNVDTSHLLDEDNYTRESQNATFETTDGKLGGLTKRPGLDRFNTVGLGAPVLGGVQVPYQGTASAPAGGGGGGGEPGDAGGTGQPGQGSGTAPGDAVNISGTTPALNGTAVGVGAGAFGSDKLFGGKRLIVMGRTQSGLSPTDYAGHGWYLSSKEFADATKELSASPFSNATVVQAGPPGGCNSANLTVGGLTNNSHRPMTLANGVLYYAGAHGTTASTTPSFPTIRRMSADGKSDIAILTIPANPLITVPTSGTAGTNPYFNRRCYIMAMLTEWGNGDAIYVAVYDDVTTGTSSGNYGRVLRVSGLDSGNYVVTEVLNTLSSVFTSFGGVSTPTVPFCLENWRGRPFVGFHRGTTTAQDPFFGEIYPNPFINGEWAYRFAANSTAHLRDVGSLCVFNGKMYVGYLASSADFAIIQELTPEPDNSTPSVGWTASTSLTATGGSSAQTSNGFYSMVVFSGALYASFWNSTESGQPTAKIYKFDGSSWTTAYSTTTVAEQVPYQLRVDNGVIYAFGANSLGATHFLSSTDGSTWTNRDTTVESITDQGTSAPVGVLYGIDQ